MNNSPGFFYGLTPTTIDTSSDVTETSPSTQMVHWTGSGHPDSYAEPGFQLVARRTSVNIWHDITVLVSCQMGKPAFAIDSVKHSSFPSLRVWQACELKVDRPQGAFSGLWQSDPNNSSFVSP